LEILEEMDKILHAFKQPTLNKEDINHVIRSKTSNGIEAILKNLITKRSTGANGIAAKIYQTFQEELVPILLILIH
jgi:phosphoglycolate phosphatase-like HAD superfamily hydrolase